MLRERLKDMGLKLTELANYLQLSRPTLYKFIELYDSGEHDDINGKVLRLFNYICENELIGKKTVIAYILDNLADIKPLGERSELLAITRAKKYILANPQSPKTKLIEELATGDTLDDIASYLIEIVPLLKRRRLTDEEAALLVPYKELLSKINDNKGDT